jgi:hypothetical protein
MAAEALEMAAEWPQITREWSRNDRRMTEESNDRKMTAEWPMTAKGLKRPQNHQNGRRCF